MSQRSKLTGRSVAPVLLSPRNFDFGAESLLRVCYALQVNYMVDMALQRHVLKLGSTHHQNYPAGKCSMQFAVPKIDIGGLKQSWLNNVGLLLVCLWFIHFAPIHGSVVAHTRRSGSSAGAVTGPVW